VALKTQSRASNFRQSRENILPCGCFCGQNLEVYKHTVCKHGLKCRAYFHFQEITDYHEELDAHREIVKMIDDQIILHESYQKEAPPQNRAM